ncbi:hypothetical protein, partial [uncultured Chryseobacterium sp.]|uniref:hypothetical protein n=1 Tax=uncultured Chryseobacterium sp. TaxID=259322 RepID=UPI002602AEAD
MIKGQEYESVISNLNITTPSASGIASKIKSPSALSTGIPEIEIPFFSLATHSKGVSINLGLSYHPNNTFMESKASDVGLGWSVLGSNNLIYREININNGNPTNNYHFNFLGRNGSFQFFKNSLGNLTLSKITENRYKITVIETGPDLYKFKIIDENGISYYFESLDISYYNPNISTNSKQNYTGGYYLTKIEDFNGNELVAFEYHEDSYTVPKSSGSILTIPVKSLKISKIISRDFGSVHFSYTFNSSDRSSYHDPFKLDAVELRNTADKRIEKYVLQSQNSFVGYPYGFISSGPNYGCNYYINQTKRRLEKVLKYGTGTSYETTEIKYSFSGNNFDITDYWTEYPLLSHDKCFTEEFKNPKYLGVALLQSIKYPNGTEVRYTFEPNQYYVDKSFPDYQFYAPPYEIKDRDAQYFEDIAFIPFDYHNTNGLSQFGLFSLPVNPDESDGYSYLFINYHVDEYYTDSPFQPENGNYVVNISFNNGINGQDGYKKYPPGSNSFVISGTGGRGSITIKRIRYKNLPLKNFSTGSGVRIKKIEYLENNTVKEALTRRYNYEMFDGSNATSGFLNDIENEQSVVYKNVKETVGQNKGYSKYYYRTLFDKAEPIQNTNDSLVFVGSEMKYVNLLSNGLFEKKEIFDDHDMLIQKDTVLSTMRSLGSNYIAAGFYYGQPIEAMRNGIIQNQKTISTIYTSSGSYTQISETTRDINDYNIIHQKNLGSDGNITETLITYPWSKRTTDPKLWNANITTVPLSVETKRNG